MVESVKYSNRAAKSGIRPTFRFDHGVSTISIWEADALSMRFCSVKPAVIRYALGLNTIPWTDAGLLAAGSSLECTMVAFVDGRLLLRR